MAENDDVNHSSIKPATCFLDVIASGSFFCDPFKDDLFSQSGIKPICRDRDIDGVLDFDPCHVRGRVPPWASGEMPSP